MKIETKNEQAVSPIIGVILMVAITVILAAIIAAFVFGMSSTALQKSRIVGATAQQTSGTGIQVTWIGGQDNTFCEYYKVNVTAPNGKAFNESVGQPCVVGSRVILDKAGSNGQDEVMVVAHFADGSENIVLDTKV